MRTFSLGSRDVQPVPPHRHPPPHTHTHTTQSHIQPTPTPTDTRLNAAGGIGGDLDHHGLPGCHL
eukprot:7247000-Prorocentrum_lima.AAC.1